MNYVDIYQQIYNLVFKIHFFYTKLSFYDPLHFSLMQQIGIPDN
jgi:hypothetical protein